MGKALNSYQPSSSIALYFMGLSVTESVRMSQHASHGIHKADVTPPCQ